MANRERGEVDVEGKDGKRHTLVLTLNAMCELEAKTKEPFSLFIKNLQTMERMRVLLWCAALDRQPTITELEVGAMVGQLSPKEVVRLVSEVMNAANPDADDLKEAEEADKARPPAAQADVASGATGGTGAGSSSTPAKSA